MGNCNNKIKHTCSSTNYSTCIHYEGSVNENSPLIGETCLDLEQTTQANNINLITLSYYLNNPNKNKTTLRFLQIST